MYEDILTFHWEALQFSRKKAFKQLIETTLQPFELRFGTIVERLERHRTLLDAELVAAFIETASEDRQREKQQRQEHKNAQRQQELLAWLKPVDYESEMAYVHKELDKFLSEECKAMEKFWLMELPAVKGWIGLENDGKPVLWLTGMPGAGKTFLAYRLFQELKQKTTEVTADCVCIAFLRSQQPAQTTYDAVLRTFIFQLLQHSPSLISYFVPEYISRSFQGPCIPMKRNELRQILDVCLEYMPGSTYVILDGLDEAEEDDRKAILQSVLALHASSKKLRTFISSRRETDIEYKLLDLGEQLEHILVGTQNAYDIDAYVTARGMDLHKVFSHDKSTWDEVESALTKIRVKACGMFLWARLVLHDLDRCTNLESLQEAVNSLPKGLEEAYQRILDRIERNRDAALGQDAKKILQMVICSKRPLRQQEIHHILAIRTGDIQIEPRRLLRRKLEELCGPILMVEGSAVCFVHFSAREYLISHMSGPFVELSACHRLLASCSMSYLLFHCFNPELSNEEIDTYIMNGGYILFNYVIQNWVFHVREATRIIATGDNTPDANTELIGQLNCLFQICSSTVHESQIQSSDVELQLSEEDDLPWLQTMRPHLYYWLRDVHFYNSCVDWQAHISYKHPLSVQGIIERIRERFRITGHASSPVDLSELQFLYGPNVFQCTYSLCPRYWDGFSTKEELNIHLQSHIRPFQCEDQSCYWSTAGFSTILELSKHNNKFHTALKESSQMSKSNMISKNVRLPSQHKVLIDAIIQGNVELVRQLLSQDNSKLSLNKVVAGKTAVEHAVEQKDREIILMLLDRGARPRDMQKFLNDAIIQGNTELVKKLLSKVDSESLSLNQAVAGKTILEYAVEREDWEIVSMLAKLGGKMHDQHRYLIDAIIQGNVKLVKWLLSHVNSWNLRLNEEVAGKMALEYAVEQKEWEMVSMLVGRGGQMHHRNRYLIDAIIQGNTELVQKLLSHINSESLHLNRVVEGKTALEYAVEQDNWEIVSMLVEKGGQVHRYLIDAIIQGNVGLVKKLSSHLNSTSLLLNEVVEGKTALEYAVEHKDVEIMMMLVEQGARGYIWNGKKAAGPLCDTLQFSEESYRPPSLVLADGDSDTRRQYLEAMFRIHDDSSPWLLALNVLHSKIELQHFLSNDNYTKTLNLISNPNNLRHYTSKQLECTPLAYVIEAGPQHCGIVKLLLQAGAKPWTKPLRNPSRDGLRRPKIIHRFLTDRGTAMKVHMVMLSMCTEPGEARLLQMLYFSHYQRSATVSKYISDDFESEWSRAVEAMAFEPSRSFLQWGIDYFAAEMVNMALYGNSQSDASILSPFASSLIELAGIIPERYKGIIRLPWSIQRYGIQSEVGDLVKRCGGSKGPIGTVVHDILSQLPLAKCPSLICQILEEAGFWAVQTFTWVCEKKVIISYEEYGEAYVEKICLNGGHARHIRFDIEVLEEVKTAGHNPNGFTASKTTFPWDISVILTHLQPMKIDRKLLYENRGMDSVCDIDGSCPRQNVEVTPQASLSYVTIDWSHRTPDQDIGAWLNNLQDNDWLGFMIRGYVTLKNIRIRGQIYYTKYTAVSAQCEH
ncbi:hypothetical protein BDZ91DRAFT_220556 [Kalaharituber pfeilii]|nr:hypothetical protein BDZ91DRAFT_220556 [Kalaharituber pfeilii]